MTPVRTLATVRHHGMELTDYEFSVPLDHGAPAGETLRIFARAVKHSEKAADTRPWLVFLQGGPGFPGPRPLKNSDWLKRALDDYHVLLLDSRGNGRSSVVLPQTLVRRGDARAQAEYLKHFRADSIVRDAEIIRRRLVGEQEAWSVLGQSYGGFCAVTTAGSPATTDSIQRRSIPNPFVRNLLATNVACCICSANASTIRRTVGAIKLLKMLKRGLSLAKMQELRLTLVPHGGGGKTADC